jgi:hypothetical protein
MYSPAFLRNNQALPTPNQQQLLPPPPLPPLLLLL